MSMRKWWLVAMIFILGIQLYLGFTIDYPPSEEQIRISVGNVWLVRIASLMLLLSALALWRNVWHRQKWDEQSFYWSTLLLTLSPIFFGLWLMHPWYCFKILIINAILAVPVKKYWFWAKFGLLVVATLVISYNQSFEKADIYKQFDFNNLQNQVMERFTREDVVHNKIDVPLLLRRISYNKYSFLVRNLVKEGIAFWNLENLFFQEINPSGKKSLPMYFWPGLILLILGIYKLLSGKILNKRFWVVLLIISFVNYLGSAEMENLRWIMAWWFISGVLGAGLKLLEKHRVYLVLISLFIVYGWQGFWFDIGQRKDYWLDNRPLVYQYFYDTLAKENLMNQTVVVTDRVGSAKKYCDYFLKNKCNDQIEFTSFNFKDSQGKPGTIYAGFVGEFYGPDFNNIFPNDVLVKIENKGFEIIDYMNIRDSVAYSYGDKLVVAKLKDNEKIY